MKNDNFLSDIESDISGDWKEIQKKLRNKEYEKQVMKNPQRLDCPDFMQFYKILLRIMQSWDSFDNPDAKLLLEFHELLRIVFAEIEDWPNPLPESFHRIWELFCNPRFYDCDRGVNCPSCQNTWDVFSKKQYQRIHNYDRFDDVNEMTVETSRISCPDCGYPMRNYMGKEVVGIIKSRP